MALHVKGLPLARAGRSGLCSPAQQNGSGNIEPDRQQVHLLLQLGHSDPDPEPGPTVPSRSSLNDHASRVIVEALDLLASGKSVREVAAATGLSKSKVGRLRSKYSGQSGTPVGHLDRSPPTPKGSQAAVAPPLTARPRSDRLPGTNSHVLPPLTD